MNIAIITDIHGNAPALRAVLQDIDRQKVEHIYCLGDMIGIGPDTNEVLEMLLERDDVTMVTGNHDESVLNLLRGEPHPASHQTTRAHHQWIADHIDPKYIPLLGVLPRVIEREYAGHRLLLLHYHMEASKRTAPFFEDPWMKIEQTPSVEQLDALYEGTDYGAVLFGHHHPLHFFQSATRLYLNPGALGCTHQPQAPYALLHLEADEPIRVELREVPYDNREFLLSYERLQVPEREFILAIFHGNQHLKWKQDESEES